MGTRPRPKLTFWETLLAIRDSGGVAHWDPERRQSESAPCAK